MNDNVQSDTTSEYPGLDSVDDAAEAILGNWNDPEEEDQVSEDTQEATDEDTEDETGDESENEESEDQDEDQESEDPDEDAEDSDEDQEDQVEEINLDEDTLVEIVVDGETKQASIKDFKRLYGQDQS
jgi:hypothetical protein